MCLCILHHIIYMIGIEFWLPISFDLQKLWSEKLSHILYDSISRNFVRQQSTWILCTSKRKYFCCVSTPLCCLPLLFDLVCFNCHNSRKPPSMHMWGSYAIGAILKALKIIRWSQYSIGFMENSLVLWYFFVL